ncbi:hypothetical protein SPLA10_PHROGS00200 [Salmonella phage SPLA10]|nr:hypothetical protein SPLA10_PHROGS00200 [Salmonella phage SPLA10]
MEILGKFDLGDTVTFQLQSGAMAIIPDSFTRCVVKSRVLAEDVGRFDIDPYSLHQLVYPTLTPNSCPSDPDKYKWLIIKTLSGSTLAIGEPWVNVDTIEAVTNTGLTIYCSSSPKNGLNLARQVLTANGFVVASIVPD